MKMRVGIACLALSGLLSMGTPAAASLVGLDVPAELLVLRGGLQWAWVSPCAPVAPSCDGNAPLVMHHDFRLVQEADWLANFSGRADILAAFNPAGAPQKCASAYFSSGYSHCDAGDVSSGAVYAVPAAWQYQGSESQWESFVVRGEQASVPEPASSLLLLGMGLVGLRAWRKR